MPCNLLKIKHQLMMYHFYLKKNYQMCIKAVYEDRFVTALREWDATSEEEREERDAPLKPVVVALRNEVERDFYLSESESEEY